MPIDFLGKPIYGRGELILEPYAHDPYDRIHAADLNRHLLEVIEKIEWHRCEGRWLPVKLFDELDGFVEPETCIEQERLDRLIRLASEVGEYYGLNDSERIDVGKFWPP